MKPVVSATGWVQSPGLVVAKHSQKTHCNRIYAMSLDIDELSTYGPAACGTAAEPSLKG